MNRQEIENNLSQMKFSHLTAPQGHKNRLKAALLEHASKHHPSVLGWAKDRITYMHTNFRFSSFAAGFVAMALLTGGLQAANNSPLLASFNPFATQEAKAQAAVKNAMVITKKMSPEQKAAAETQMKADMEDSLKEAQEAKDLTILTGQEMMESGSFSLQFSKENGKEGEPLQRPDIEKYLKYTDSQGRTVILGLSREGVPVLKVMRVQILEGDAIRMKQGLNASGDFTTAGNVEFKKAEGEDSVLLEVGNVLSKPLIIENRLDAEVK